MEIETHTETIQCPECDKIQDAVVFHTPIYWTYLHRCISCRYVVMESEWDVVKNTDKTI